MSILKSPVFFCDLMAKTKKVIMLSEKRLLKMFLILIWQWRWRWWQQRRKQKRRQWRAAMKTSTPIKKLNLNGTNLFQGFFILIFFFVFQLNFRGFLDCCGCKYTDYNFWTYTLPALPYFCCNPLIFFIINKMIKINTL